MAAVVPKCKGTYGKGPRSRHGPGCWAGAGKGGIPCYGLRARKVPTYVTSGQRARALVLTLGSSNGAQLPGQIALLGAVECHRESKRMQQGSLRLRGFMPSPMRKDAGLAGRRGCLLRFRPFRPCARVGTHLRMSVSKRPSVIVSSSHHMDLVPSAARP